MSYSNLVGPALAAIGLLVMGCPSTPVTEGTPADDAEPVANGDVVSTMLDGGDAASEETEVPSPPEADAMPDQSGPADVVEDAQEPVPEGPIGGDRPAVVTLPDNYTPGKAWPVVMLLHGFSANGFIQDAYLQFSAQATELGFIAIVPNGTQNPDGDRFWNAMPACCDFYNSGVDDEGYLLDLIEEATSLWNVDASRVFLVGHSNGGYMSFRMACSHPNVFRGLVSIAGSSYASAQACSAQAPVSIMQVHGSLDTIVDYGGTAFTPGAQEIVDRWVARNECALDPVDDGTRDYDDAVPGAETTVTWHRQCAGGVEVGFLDMAGSGHVPTFKEQFIKDAVSWLLERPGP